MAPCLRHVAVGSIQGDPSSGSRGEAGHPRSEGMMTDFSELLNTEDEGITTFRNVGNYESVMRA